MAGESLGRVMILSSMTFAEDIIAKKSLLEGLGYQVSIPEDTELVRSQPDLPDDLEADLKHCIETDQLRKGFQLVADADSVLVLNHPKNGIPGYIGTSVLMELAIAHFLRKPIFTLFAVPSYHEHRWAHEVAMVEPINLEGEVTRLAVGLAVWRGRENFEQRLGPCADAEFRSLLSWSWRELRTTPTVLDERDEDTPSHASTSLQLPNRLRDLERCLSRGLLETGRPDFQLRSRTGVLVATGYIRLVLGDHGPYCELRHSQICWPAFTTHVLKGPGRHYHQHFGPDGLELYEQFRGVGQEPNPPPGPWSCANNRPEGYADYQPGRFYLPADLLEPGT